MLTSTYRMKTSLIKTAKSDGAPGAARPALARAWRWRCAHGVGAGATRSLSKSHFVFSLRASGASRQRRLRASRRFAPYGAARPPAR